MKSSKEFFRNLILSERAQASAEYVLLLAIMVGISIAVLKKIFGPIMGNAAKSLERDVKGQFFKEDNFHQLPIRR
ncbi:MAG: hypothetical protein JNL01_10295 [Bdellovibrionales bacterium]|nr:hypothetical protein [Bdellovibrionales bacterium]